MVVREPTRDKGTVTCVAPDEGIETIGSALVVGAGADWAQAAATAAQVDCVLFFSLEGAAKLADALGYRGKVIDLPDRMSDAELQAWDWSVSLSDHLLANEPLLSADVLHEMRRMLFLQLFWPIAVARERARLAVASVPSGYAIRTCGLTDLENAEFDGHVQDATSAADSRIGTESHDSTLSGPIRKALSRARALIRLSVTKLRRQHRLRRLRGSLKALGRSNESQPLAVVLVGVPVHLRLLDSPLRELKSRGWRLLLMDLSSDGDVSADARRLGAEDTRFMPMLEPTTPVLQLFADRRTRTRLAPVVDSWARSADLELHASRIFAEVCALYESMMCWTRAHREWVRSLRPNLVLTVSEISPIVETVVPVCRSSRIPTVNVQHGSALDIPLNSDFRFDAFCVWGEGEGENLERCGTNPARIYVTGNPYMDCSARDETSASAPEPTVALRRSEGDRERFNILFATGYAWAMASDVPLYQTLGVVLEYAERDPSCHVCVKLHPVAAGHELGYEMALAEHPNASVSVVREGDLYELIRDSDCIATWQSTVAYEAVTFRKPTIILNLGGSNDLLPLVPEGVALRAADGQQFAECVERLRAGEVVTEEAFAAFERRYSFGQDGRAGSRIADVCEELAGLSGSQPGADPRDRKAT